MFNEIFMFLGILLLALGLADPGDKTQEKDKPDLLVFTVATEANDAYERFMQSAEKYHVQVTVLGMGETWRGGDVTRFAGGGQKVNLLKEGIKKYKDNKSQLVMFTDSYDVIIANTSEEIVKRFHTFDADIVFAAETSCWPEASLKDSYPMVGVGELRFLNSGGFIGYASQIAKLLEEAGPDFKDSDDDQLFYTKLYLSNRKTFGMELDKRSLIFQNLNGAIEDVVIQYQGQRTYLYNIKTDKIPAIVHGNGPKKIEFNRLTNYIPDKWNPTTGCLACEQQTVTLDDDKPETFPRVLMVIFLRHPTAFLEDFFEHISQLTYPKNKTDVFLHYTHEMQKKYVDKFLSQHESQYKSVMLHLPSENLTEKAARQFAFKEAQRLDVDLLLSVDGECQVENVETVQFLIEANRSVVAPLLLRPGKLWSNFWGAVSSDGYYKRSEDYMDIVKLDQLGLWNVPYISGVYLVQKRHFKTLVDADWSAIDMDPDITISQLLRAKMVFMYVDNRQYFGHLIDNEDVQTTRKHPDLYELFNNRYTWEKKYIHAEYNKTLNLPFSELKQVGYQPCPDVFWLPLVTEKFCQDLVEEMEFFGQWSGGKHEDTRLAGGYENVPTVDIHTNQIGWEKHWLAILKDYIAPYTQKAFEGYYPDAKAIMNFVVRYKPGEQDRLRPHNDASTFSVNIALNNPHTDYEGGGTRFLRYNCSVTQSQAGWMLIHPGRLTHHHEGLRTTKGTRYIMVSFVDP